MWDFSSQLKWYPLTFQWYPFSFHHSALTSINLQHEVRRLSPLIIPGLHNQRCLNWTGIFNHLLEQLGFKPDITWLIWDIFWPTVNSSTSTHFPPHQWKKVREQFTFQLQFLPTLWLWKTFWLLNPQSPMSIPEYQ